MSGVDIEILVSRAAATIADAIALPTFADLAREIPLDRLRAMTAAQRDRLARKVAFCRAFAALARLNGRRHGIKGQLDPILTREAAKLAGLERVSLTQGERWRRRFRRGGAVSLIDDRGRPLGPVPLDAGLVVALAERLAAGQSLAAAHRAVRAERAAWGLRTPCLCTLSRRFAEGAAEVAIPENKPANHRLDYLVKGCSRN